MNVKSYLISLKFFNKFTSHNAYLFLNNDEQISNIAKGTVLNTLDLTLFRLGVLEILYDWGVECARAVCLFISQQFLTIELLFKFV